jgi:arylsulfatase A-like enzyme
MVMTTRTGRRAIRVMWLLLLAASLPAVAAARPPSVLVILTDDQRADTIHAFGNPHIRTPALDALAARGTSFDRAYCMGSLHGAVCIPSRAMMLAGRSLFRRDEHLEGQESWPEVFGRSGRRTFLTGKWHNGEAAAVRCFETGRDVFFGGMTDQWNVPVRSFPAGGGAERLLTPPTIATGIHSARLFGDAAVDFLERLGDEPFFAWVSFTVPHDPRAAPEEFRSRYVGHEPPPPANWLPEHPFDNGELAVRDEVLLPRPLSRAGVSKELADAYACVESVDAEVGRIVETLKARGRLEDTLILFLSDHGLALGSHGLLGKQNLYEHSMRSPAILAGPGVPAGRREGALCHLPDLVATVGELAAVPEPAGNEGVSLVPVLHGERSAVRDALLLAYRHLQRAIVTPDWKLIRYPEVGREQLFHLAEDPDELHDLAADIAQAPRIAALRERLGALMASADDPLAPTAAIPPSPARRPDRPPNIVFFLADDLGTGDVATLGSKYALTPHIDALFARGTRLARHWAGSAVCAPSRCVLMTGLHPGHAPVRSNSEVQPEGQRPLPQGTVTLPRILHDAGHATGCFGKWGLGPPGSESDPMAAGFDRFFGYNCQRHAHSFYPTYLWDGREKVPLDNPPIPVTATLPADPAPTAADFARFRGTTYSADRIGDEAIRFVREHADRPFFLYVPTTLPHVALQVPADEPSLASHRRYFGAEAPYLGGKGYVPCAEPAATLAAMVTRMDRDVGRIVDTLEELGLTDDTIIVFTSDNGATFPGAGGVVTDRMKSNGDLRDWKGSPYEGGLRVPAVVVWPGKISAGASIDMPTGCEDWLPTLLDLAVPSAPRPSALDGRSLARALLGTQAPPATRTLYRELTERRWQTALEVTADGCWKVVRRSLGRETADLAAPTELYDLVTDPIEAHDIAADRPDVVARMEAILDREHLPDPAWPLPFADAAAERARITAPVIPANGAAEPPP